MEQVNEFDPGDFPLLTAALGPRLRSILGRAPQHADYPDLADA